MPLVSLANFQQLTAINLNQDPGRNPGKISIPLCAQISLVWTLDGSKTAHNVLYGRYVGAFAGTVAQCDAIKTALTTGAPWTTYATTISTLTALAAVTIRDVNTIDNGLVSSIGAATPGTGSGVAMPDEVAACVTLRTAKVGPGNRGRMYLPGFAANASTTGNVINPGTVTAVNGWVATIAGALSGQGYTWVLGQPARLAYTSPNGTPHPARPAGSLALTSTVLRDNHWDSQRRRGLK